jgi:hypothetical protein
MKFRAYILDWRMYRGVSCDVHDSDLAPGIWSVALATGKYETWAVEANSVEEVFAKLNADDRPNGRIMRSLSVGDLVVNCETGAVKLVAMVGWKDLDTRGSAFSALKEE